MEDTSESESEETMQDTSESEESTSESDLTIEDSSEESTSESDLTIEDSSEEMINLDYAGIRQKLRESGVIGRVLDDFMPCMLLHVVYPDKLITLGDRLSLGQVQTKPRIYGGIDDSFPEILEARPNGRYLIVMTDPGAPGGEYLHAAFITSVMDPELLEAPLEVLIAHEPPRTAGRMIVFTLFTASESQNIYVPNLRENFSTRDFAVRNAFAPPLTATFFYIERENEKNNGNCDNESPRCDRNGSPSPSKTAYALLKPMDTCKIVFKLFKPKVVQPVALSSSLGKKKGGDVRDDSSTGTSVFTSCKRKENGSATCSTAQMSTLRICK